MSILKSNAWRRQAEIIADGQQFKLVGTQILAEYGTKGSVHYAQKEYANSVLNISVSELKGTRPLTRMFGLPDENANDKNCVIAFTQLQRSGSAATLYELQIFFIVVWCLLMIFSYSAQHAEYQLDYEKYFQNHCVLCCFILQVIVFQQMSPIHSWLQTSEYC
ncbi:Hypothetical_protein [Hexamita inflata]|uniref:Hypothetical_protein n=1 Tax=Hexamita inflata TaxID=28002 RepID=A0AA86RJ75_9EUKA|nr:Hypothetical protein HINF_LOCUS63026 [Hexamita inflata]